jgi:hypothetical protein
MHELPFWFLLVGLFVPRLSLFVVWLGGGGPLLIGQPGAGLLWFFIARFYLVAIIYSVQGASGWFYIHLVVACLSFFIGCVKGVISVSS